MSRIIHKCPTCGKPADLASEMKVGTLSIRQYKCGHSECVRGTAAAQTDTLDIESLDGKRLFPFQLEGAQFVEKSNIRALIADEMGLGKTVQAAAVVVAHRQECLPVLVFCKAGLRMQWSKEMIRWGDLVFQVIEEGSNARLFPGADGYIVSLDSAWRIGTKAVKDSRTKKIEYEKIPGRTLPEQMKKCGVKCVIIDECQQIKNMDSKRTKAVQDCCADIEHVVALSGTPIKNNAAEYFPVLNILRPEKFPSKSQFVYGWCDSYFNGYGTKTGGLKNPQKFMAYTADFIIRRERKQVLPDLPTIFRQFQFCELGKMVEDMYKKEIKEYQEYYRESEGVGAFDRNSNILARLSKLRHLTGLAKIEPVVEYVDDFIMTTDRKIMIFVHHKDVGETLALKLRQRASEWKQEWGEDVLQLTSDMDLHQRDEVVTKFASSDYRVLIGSTLASGEGLNLQFCSDCIMMERQWNPANEEQAEARFPRPGSTADKVNAVYFIATGTVDEFFSKIVEQKREICAKTMRGEAVKWDQSSLMKELAGVLAEKGGQQWGF